MINYAISSLDEALFLANEHLIGVNWFFLSRFAISRSLLFAFIRNDCIEISLFRSSTSSSKRGVINCQMVESEVGESKQLINLDAYKKVCSYKKRGGDLLNGVNLTFRCMMKIFIIIYLTFEYVVMKTLSMIAYLQRERRRKKLN